MLAARRTRCARELELSTYYKCSYVAHANHTILQIIPQSNDMLLDSTILSSASRAEEMLPLKPRGLSAADFKRGHLRPQTSILIGCSAPRTPNRGFFSPSVSRRGPLVSYWKPSTTNKYVALKRWKYVSVLHIVLVVVVTTL